MKSTLILSNVAEGVHAEGRMTFTASSAISAKHLFGKPGSSAGQIALAGSGNTSTGSRAIGVITDEAEEIGDAVSVSLMGASGSTLRALAGGAISIGSLLTSNTDSKAVDVALQSTGTYYVYGIALNAASSGGIVEFIPCVGVTQSV